MAKKLNPEALKRLKTFFLENDISFEDLSENSQNICGVSLSVADIKYLSRSDNAGPWSIQKSNKGRSTKDVPVQEKLSKVADKLYEMIINEEDPVPSNSIAQLAKTWSEMLMKANMTKDISAKTDPQTVKDMFARFEAEANARD